MLPLSNTWLYLDSTIRTLRPEKKKPHFRLTNFVKLCLQRFWSTILSIDHEMPKLLTLKNNVALITDDIEAWYSHFLYERFMLPSHLPCDIKIASDTCPWLSQCRITGIYSRNFFSQKLREINTLLLNHTLWCVHEIFPSERKFLVFYHSIDSQSLEHKP